MKAKAIMVKRMYMAVAVLFLISGTALAESGENINTRLDKKGDRIENRLDNKGAKIDRRLDRRGNLTNERKSMKK
jgi:hypothetical protein